MPSKFFQVSLFFFSTIQALESAKPLKKYEFADSTDPIALTFKNIYKAFSDFKCNLQVYYLFSKVPVCTQNPKDIDEPDFFVSS